ncbi:Mettl5, partial [Symbiodinium microadriaticum]
IWGAACPISPYISALGWSVGPLIDPALSSEYDLCSRRVFEWIAFLLERGRVDALGASLPLATFSPASTLVEASTQKQRDALWCAFARWLSDQGISAEELTQPPGSSDVDSVNCILTRRLLQPAWDLAFSWKRAEPGRHHTAMPWQVLLGLVTTALLWGWPRTAGLLALSWGGLLRIGEALAARRSDLMLPADVWNTIDFAYLSIREPKTRYSAARHQSVRIDQPNVLKIVTVAFQALGPAEKLWPSSAQTLRTRFRQLCNALRLPCGSSGKLPGLELASLRAGGATWLLMADEDSELVRRRGRWLTSKIMEIYIQEVSSIQFLPSLQAEPKRLVYAALEAHVDILRKAEFFIATGILPHLWYKLFAARTVAVDDAGTLGGAAKNL